MHTNVILAKKRRIHTQSNYTNTKPNTWFRRLLRHPVRKRSGSILHRYTPRPSRGLNVMKRTYFMTVIDGVFYADVRVINRRETCFNRHAWLE